MIIEPIGELTFRIKEQSDVVTNSITQVLKSKYSKNNKKYFPPTFTNQPNKLKYKFYTNRRFRIILFVKLNESGDYISVTISAPMFNFKAFILTAIVLIVSILFPPFFPIALVIMGLQLIGIFIAILLYSKGMNIIKKEVIPTIIKGLEERNQNYHQP